MQEGYHLMGGGSLLKKFKIAATFANAGIPTLGVTNAVGINPVSTTSALPTFGLALDTATYSSSQSATHAEGLVTVSIRPDLVIRALMSGGSTEGTALTTLSNTSASAAGTTITDADVGSADMTGATVWCTQGANRGRSRSITTHNSGTSFVVTVAFEADLAVGDEFLFCPYNVVGVDDSTSGVDAISAVQTTTLFTQADASIAAGTGLQATVVDLELNGASDSYVLFMLVDSVYAGLNGQFTA